MERCGNRRPPVERLVSACNHEPGRAAGDALGDLTWNVAPLSSRRHAAGSFQCPVNRLELCESSGEVFRDLACDDLGCG